jgi:predicted MFS family arabinose efflux permease
LSQHSAIFGSDSTQLERSGGWTLVWALSVAQLVSWGAIYYSFSLFVVPMEAELHWSRTSLNGALSLGLLTSGVCAYPVGAWIDRHGGRLLMTLGSVAGAALLLIWSRTTSETLFYAIWIGLGAVMAGALYEPVFAVLTRSFRHTYRTKITVLTLLGGLASTVFIPLTQLFIAELGWRNALVALAACLLVICLPIHAFLLRDRDGGAGAGSNDEGAAANATAFRRALRHPVFWGLALCLVGYNGTFSALTFHLIPMLTERGLPMRTIILALAVIGPAQVAGRIVVFALGGRLSTPIAGRIVVLVLPLSVVFLLLFPTSMVALFAFAVLYGGANGIMTIIRGTAVPDLMWREGYGAINGALGLPSTVARAVAPFAAALIWEAGGYDAVLWSVIVGSLFAAAAFWFAAASAEPRSRPT